MVSTFCCIVVAYHCALLQPRPAPREASIQQSYDNVISSAHTAHQLKPRIPIFDLIQFDNGVAITPIEDAAQFLAYFYTQVALSCQTQWSTIPPRIWIKVTLGNVQLLIAATEGYTIPWVFVRRFALDMLNLVNRGYIGTFDAYHSTPGGEGGIIFSLTCEAIGAFNAAAALIAAASGENGANGANGGSRPLNANAKPFASQNP